MQISLTQFQLRAQGGEGIIISELVNKLAVFTGRFSGRNCKGQGNGKERYIIMENILIYYNNSALSYFSIAFNIFYIE